MTTETQEKKEQLKSFSLDEVKETNDEFSNDVMTTEQANPEMVKKADEKLSQLLNFSERDLDQKDAYVSAVENFGLGLEKNVASTNMMLKNNLNKLAKTSEEGNDITKALVDLAVEVEKLDPVQLDDPNWIIALLGKLPFVGTPMKRYFLKYEDAQDVIEAIFVSLEKGAKQLEEDNKTIKFEQKSLREKTFELMDKIVLGKLLDEKLAHHIRMNEEEGSDRQRFLQEELLFPLRQRVLDMETTLQNTQQGILTYEVLVRNNKELMKGVHRAQTTTRTALEIGVTAAFALANQKIVLDKLVGVRKTTENLLLNNAKRLKTQGVQIQKQASEASISVDVLKKAFADINQAMNDISTFKQEALPKLSQAINELDDMNKEGEKRIKKLEEGNKASASKLIDLDA